MVHSPDFDDDEILPEYLFRNFEEMPPIEQAALKLCKGKVLDVGCGAGSHALYLQNSEKLEVKAIDTSPRAIEITKKRGIYSAACINFFELENEKFDSMLFLMNGSGIIGKLENIPRFFKKCREILKETGKILMDSSDLVYLFDEKPAEHPYYGELQFSLSYKGESSSTFDWLYIDEEMLKFYAAKNKFSCKIVKRGEHFDYLAQLKPL
ncbi:SAM-dependent methyltransferase [Christiangramia fulva]|uniref:SAM-dependent methyltransferase n=2 Tax=Christiangramia fulva TaxID=2126553 RepID=A0A2R3ZB18_9FLAO|nr:SAM-dependent methyltransferase [Christiangramia fulva]